MNKQDFTDTLNNMKDLTLGQIFKLILNLKYKTILMIFFMVSGSLGGAFTAGKYSHQKETAVMLESPFAMRLDLDGKQYDFENLTLNKDPTMLSPAQDKVVLSLREIKSAFDVVPVGKVVAQIEDTRLSGFWRIFVSRMSIVGHAHAKDEKVQFDWNGHANDFKFKESFVEKDLVHRYYADGCILQYRVDANRKSIPSSFMWLRLSH